MEKKKEIKIKVGVDVKEKIKEQAQDLGMTTTQYILYKVFGNGNLD